jgi:hypothetical protein
MRISLLTLAAGWAFATPAMAQDTTETDKGFAGIYVGAAVGYDVQSNRIREFRSFDCTS